MDIGVKISVVQGWQGAQGCRECMTGQWAQIATEYATDGLDRETARLLYDDGLFGRCPAVGRETLRARRGTGLPATTMDARLNIRDHESGR